MLLNTNRRLKVFIYHLDNDRDFVQALCDRLELNEVDVVLPEDIDYEAVSGETDAELPQQARGQKEAFRRTVQNVDVVLFCFSGFFNDVVSLQDAEWQIMLDAALEKRQGDIYVLPICLEESLIPERMKRWQPIKLYEKGGYEELVYALKVRADKLGLPLKLRTDWDENPYIATEQVAEPERAAPRSSYLMLGLILLVSMFSVFVLFQVNMQDDISVTQTAGAVQSLGERATQVIVARATDRAATVTADASAYNESRMQTEVFLTGEPLTQAALATERVTPTVTPSLTATITPTTIILPTQITDTQAVVMVLVPEGNFTLGQDGKTDANPAQVKSLPAYYIDQYEVSNAQYAQCVAVQACQPPKALDSQRREKYYDAPDFVDYPVIHVDWSMAQAYCAWRDARLPTEAEWEKAARGDKALIHPWGAEIDCNFANYNNCVGDTTITSKYVLGGSVYGAFNMAGNVAEWTSSVFMPYPYNPLDGREAAPASSGPRVLRGGSWASSPSRIFTYYRQGLDPTSSRNDLGFRCARDVTQ
jgi:formylglycine-generating enzyme required for sulfatase activity